MSGFKVYVNWPIATPEEWNRALNAPVRDLPPLTSERRAIVKAWDVREEDERRNVLRLNLAEERVRAEAEKLGQVASAVLKPLGEGYHLRAVIRHGLEDDVLRFETPHGVTELTLARALRERLLHDGGIGAEEDLRREMLTLFGRQDLLVGR